MSDRSPGWRRPVLVEQSLLYLVGFSDTLLTGRYLSEDHLAAVTVASYLLWFLGSLLTIVSVGATALVARLIGSKDRAGAEQIGQQAIAMALVVGTLTLIVGWAVTPGVVHSMNLGGAGGLRGGAVPADRPDGDAAPGLHDGRHRLPPRRGRHADRDVGDDPRQRRECRAELVARARGFGPFPCVGAPGDRGGDARAAKGVGGLVVLAVLTRGRAGLRLDWRGAWPVGTQVRRILRISLPAAGESLTNILCQLWFLRLINHLGDVATAAHGVAIKCEAIAFLTVTAFSVAAGTLTGQYLGACRPDLAGRAGSADRSAAWAAGVVVWRALGVVVYTQAAFSMFAVFLGGRQPQVAAMGVPVLRVVAFALPALATINGILT